MAKATVVQTQEGAIPQREFLGIAEAAAWIGLSKHRMKMALARGELRGHKFGRGARARVFILISDLRNFVMRG